jgi:hypothetical protein
MRRIVPIEGPNFGKHLQASTSMKYELRKDQAAFTPRPAPPPDAPPSPSSSNDSDPDLAELATQYEPEVFDLVRSELNEGHSFGRVVQTLTTNDFAEDEARRVVQAVVDDRERRGFEPPAQVNILDPLGLNRSHDLGDLETAAFRRKARRDQGTRDMLIGFCAILAGIVLSLVTQSARFVLGLSIVGCILIFRGAITYGVNHRE